MNDKTIINKQVCAHYISTYLPITEVWIYNLLKRFSKWQPMMLTRRTKNFEEFTIDKIINLSNLNKFEYIFNFIFFKLRGFFPIFLSKCRQSDVKILHVHFGYHGIKSIQLKRHLKVPMICSFYGNDVYKKNKKNNYLKNLKQLFEKVDKVLVLGPYMRNTLIDMGCPENKIKIHHLGVDVEKIKFKIRNFKKIETLRFLITSSFIEKKGIDIALKALKIVKEKTDFRLDIIGDGPLRANLIQLVNDLGLKDQVVFHGYQNYTYFIDLAYYCHIFLQASKTALNGDKEGTPMALVDAMATGLPIISTFHSDIPEIVEVGKNGYLAEENNVMDFAENIYKLLNDINNLDNYSENARKYVEKNFNSSIEIKKLESLYTELINKNQ